MKTLESYLSHRDVVVRPVEDGWVVIDVPDGHGDGADVLQRGLALVTRLDRDVDQLLSLGFVSVENLEILNMSQSSGTTLLEKRISEVTRHINFELHKRKVTFVVLSILYFYNKL